MKKGREGSKSFMAFLFPVNSARNVTGGFRRSKRREGIRCRVVATKAG